MIHAPCQIRRQRGFTLPEILAVIALIGILMSTVVTSFGTAERELAMASSKDTLLNDIPTALISYRAIHGSLIDLDKADDITSTGISGNGPFGDAWTLGRVTARTAIVNWVLTGAEEADAFGGNLETSLNNITGSAIRSTTYDDNEDTLEVKYRIP